MTTIPLDLTIAGLSRDRAPELLDLDAWAFAAAVHDVDPEPVIAGLEWPRTYGAWRQKPDRLAGIYSVYPMELPVPGGRLPAAGLTWVGVHPRDRRRGVLTAMIRHHLDDVRDRGEPVSVLNAAEPGIYGRFGYGVASWGVALRPGRGAQLREVPGADDLVVDLEPADADRQAAEFAGCYDAARVDRPGWVSRDSTGNRRLPFWDPPSRREGAEQLRAITVRRPGPDGELRGYALFRRRRSWVEEVPQGTVEVREIVAVDGAAARALWGQLLDLDLMATVQTPGLAVDDPLIHLLVDARAAGPRVRDGLWLRPVDLPAMLAGRRSTGPLDAVLDVTDALLPDNSGRWRLRAAPGDPIRADRTDTEADLRLGVAELGSAVLGGVTLSALAGAGLVTARDATALRTASAALSWPVAPYCPWEF